MNLNELFKEILDNPNVELVIAREGEDPDDALERHLKGKEARSDNLFEEVAKDKGEESLARALKGVRTSQAILLKKYDILKALEKSLLTPLEERTPKHMLDELVMFIELTK